MDLIALGLAIIHLIVNGEMLSFFVRDHKGKDGNLSKQEKFEIKKTAGKITNFEKKFATKDKNELARIVKENRLVPEAIEAAIRLLEK